MPTSLLPQYGTSTGTHLILANRVLADKEYAQYYKARSQSGDLVIIDNGAFELGRSLPGPDLIEAASRVAAKEIVLPDVLRDAFHTVRGVTQFLHDWDNSRPKWSMGLWQPTFMVVPQGRNAEEWYECLEELVRLVPRATLGLFEELAEWTGSRFAFLQDLHARHMCKPKKRPIHLLGMQEGRELIDEIVSVRSAFSCVRSIDSGKPITYALHGIEIGPIHQGQSWYYTDHAYLGRDKNHFDLPKSADKYPRVMAQNIKFVKEMAGDG